MDRNFEKSGNFDEALKDFDSMNPKVVRDINTKCGPGKLGYLEDGYEIRVTIKKHRHFLHFT